MKNKKFLGQVAYEAYCEGAGLSGTTDGKPIPKFHELQEASQRGWIFSAVKILQRFSPPIQP